MPRAAVIAGVFVYALACMGARVAGQVSPAAPEVAVNSYTEHSQRAPVSCRTGAGEVVIWQSDKQDGRGWGVYGQRYDAGGGKSGSEFRVHSNTAGSESHPAIACAGDGRFIVAWDSDHPGRVRGVFAQLFDAAGAVFGTEFQVNNDMASDSVLPALCTAADGSAVVAWQGYHPNDRHDIFARRLSSTGELLGSEFRVNTHVESTQSRPAVGCHANGDFVIVWDSDVQDGADFGVFAQRYDREGIPQGFELQVSSTTVGSQQRPRVAVGSADHFVIVWESRSRTLGNYEIFGQRFSSRGPLGTEFRIGRGSGGNQTRPAVDTDARGDFVVVWASEDEGAQIHGQRYTSGGDAIGAAFRVTGAMESSGRSPWVAAAASGDFTVAWQRHEADSGDDGIAARRFVVCGNGTLDPGEACDDGNVRDGDCCSAQCEFEQAKGLREQALSCPNLGPESLVCAIAESAARVACDDSNACTSDDACQYGVCVGGARVDCDDRNPCTSDSCRAQVGCLNAPNTLPCDDGNVCTASDTCRAGACRAGPPLTCDDANVCTDDRCDPTHGCISATNAAPCEDGDQCTAGDRCIDGTCRAGGALSCDDANTCTDDGCDPIRGCAHAANTAACDDGDPCTSVDACLDGVCRAGQPNSCDDANPCTEDHCEAGFGCRNTPAEAPCNDGNACTQQDRCDTGRCRGVDAMVCTAIDSCHGPGTCDPATGQCSTPPLPDGRPCDDGVLCTVGDRCVTGLCTPGRSGAPFLVKDIHAGAKSSAPVELLSTGGRVFFRGDDGTHGRELWATDGSVTAMIADIRPGNADSAPSGIVSSGARIFFAATDAGGDRELWTSDGTAAGTQRVRDIGVGRSANPTALVAAGAQVYFVADDGAHGQELWSSDGTEAGTFLVQDVRPGRCGPGACDGRITDLTAVDGRLFFTADDGNSGRELWTTEGPATGALMIDIRPGADGSQPAFLTAYQGGIVFAANDGLHGKELWRSGGDGASTHMIADLRPGECDSRPCSSSPSYLTSTEGTLFFAVAGTDRVPPSPQDDERGNFELWRSDGSRAGTKPVAPLPGLPYVRRAMHSNLIFAAGSGVRTALWHSDGTSTGTRSLAAAGATSPAWPINLDGRVFFSATDRQHGTELWSSDGTEAGTVFVHDINGAGSSQLDGSSSPASLTAAGDLLFFSADDGKHGRELWALCR